MTEKEAKQLVCKYGLDVIFNPLTHKVVPIGEKFQYDYDQEADCLYISFGEPRPCLGKEKDGLILRFDINTDEFVGVTITSFKKKLAKVLRLKLVPIDMPEVDRETLGWAFSVLSMRKDEWIDRAKEYYDRLQATLDEKEK